MRTEAVNCAKKKLTRLPRLRRQRWWEIIWPLYWIMEKIN